LNEITPKPNVKGDHKMNTDRIRCLAVGSMFAIAALVLLLSASAQKSLAQGPWLGPGLSGAVYTLSNQPTGNSVIVFDRAADGTLTLVGSFPTGGTGFVGGPLGTIDPLGSQGSVVLNESNRLLFAVNAGSNSVSEFAVDGDSLILLNTVTSGGTLPISVAVHGRLVYVLNAGGTPNISGFTMDFRTNKLVPLAGSARPLAGGTAANPAEVSFSLDGSVLMVTEKGDQLVDTYTVNWDGTVSGPISNLSSGPTPFGFEFTHSRIALVAEAGGSSDALSSYRADENGKLDLITGSLLDGQKASCWAIVTSDGRYDYVINAGSSDISGYAVSAEGYLTLLNPTAAVTASGSAPTDPALSSDSHFLYVRDDALGEVHGFRVEVDGSLTPVSDTGGIPAGDEGMAAR
jgi:6-phosphogluconolactonase